MVTPRFPAMMDIPGNDSRHNQTDPNRGGGPRHMPKSIPQAQRGGFGQKGNAPARGSMGGGGRATAPNPASRGGQSIGSMQPQARIPGHGGSPQKGNLQVPRQFGKSGQQGVPTGPHANPKPGAGNTSGASYRMIAGRFKRAAMGAKATGSSGKYGSPPVSANT